MNKEKRRWSPTSPGHKKQHRLAGGLLALALLFPAGAAIAAPTEGEAQNMPAADVVVEFKDANFKACVAAELELEPSANITQADMATLRGLDCRDQEISDISPLQYSPDVTSLNLDNNQISDISSLAGHSNLSFLALVNNKVSDLTGVEGLTNLEELYLSNNQIASTAPMTGLPKLRIIDLNDNQVSDLTGLTDLTALEELYLTYNQISDVTPLAGLTKLVILGLEANRIIDLSPLAGLQFTGSFEGEEAQVYLEDQRVSLEDVQAGTAYELPVLKHIDGSVVDPEGASTGGTIKDGKVTWSPLAGETGTVTWSKTITFNNIEAIFTGEMTQNILPREPIGHPDRVALRTGNQFEVTRPDADSTFFSYGRADDEVFFGDWTNAGADGIAVRRGISFHAKATIGTGVADISIEYGRAGDEVFVGDWNGDGVDTFAIRRGNTFYVKNDVAGGPADQTFAYGRAGDEVLVGDWDGDGVDTFAIRRGNTFYVKNDVGGGAADQTFAYGRAGDEVLVGDWDGDGVDTFIVRRGATFFVKNSISAGPADETRILGTGSELAYSVFVD